MSEIKQDQETTTWDEVFKTTGFMPDFMKQKKERVNPKERENLPMTLKECHAKAGGFPFRARKVGKSVILDGRALAVGTEIEVLEGSGYAVDFIHYDEHGILCQLVDSKTWELV